MCLHVEKKTRTFTVKAPITVYKLGYKYSNIGFKNVFNSYYYPYSYKKGKIETSKSNQAFQKMISRRRSEIYRINGERISSDHYFHVCGGGFHSYITMQLAIFIRPHDAVMAKFVIPVGAVCIEGIDDNGTQCYMSNKIKFVSWL